MNNSRPLLLPSAIGLLAILSFWKLWLIRDVIWDDNCWLLSAYATSSLSEFLDTGFNQMQRPLVGVLMYYLFGLHKTSELFYLVWHGLTLITEIASPLLLFYLVRQLFPGQQLLAVFTAFAFVLLHLDHSLPYVSAINYRLGQTLSLTSLLLTASAIGQGSRIGWKKYVMALALGLISHSVLMEAAIALEPGRIAIIGWVFYVSGARGTALARRTAAYSAPFLVAIVPLVVHKILHKPYGIYAESYVTNSSFFLNFNKNLEELWYLLVRDWFGLIKVARYTDIAGVVSWVLSAMLLVLVIRHLAKSTVGEAPHAVSLSMTKEAPAPRICHAILLALLLLLPPLWLFEYAGLDTTLFGSQNNAHAIFMQSGYALLLGAGLTGLCRKYVVRASHWKTALLVLPLSLGALINNGSIDLFHKSWRDQTRFWQTFVDRFPSLPERADFLFDIRGQGTLSDLRNHYDHEIWLNLLYSDATGPADFKRYRVMTLEDFAGHARKNPTWPTGSQRFERVTQLGPEAIDTRQLIAVLYAGNQLYVGHEILERFGKQVPYWPLLRNHDASEAISPNKTRRTPWRTRLEGF